MSFHVNLDRRRADAPVDDHLAEQDFVRIAELVNGRTGIRLPPAKRTMIEARLRKRVRAHGLSSMGAYCRFLFDQGGLEAELSHLVDVVTTNKTDFFREPDHFRFLAGPGIETMLARQGQERGARLHLWSAASSNGAEAYTIAMVLRALAERSRRFDFAILGTDISTAMLRHAQRAVYPGDFVAPVPAEMRRRYLLTARDPRQNEVRIVPELRERVRFAHLNLMEPSYPFERHFDAIFLRNVLIYFEREVQVAVTRRLISHLRPGGYLFVGHSETSVASALPVRQVAPAIFQLK
ncbi:CheR family methyltransferase [Rhodobacter maris]|uniref:Chemotaxis protein methyltransferase n=1 Tax=Rhodobacter maris TaxID=446682 RepID=A0A285TM81_9RHOB|nr:CheR family methyltransferase [Rhodobacter maris]SOC23693.1 chemotaxis protein methyltransferase CheR [Rhodobacter maris]